MSYQQKLYDDLTQLVRTNEAFYTVDHEINGVVYRVFTYRLASYTDFLLPNALECRGHMFRVEPRQQVTLVSLPFEKFFNLGENPFTMDLDLTEVEFIHDKRDGSLISTYVHDGEVRLKSKTSLSSDQALDAMRLFNADYTLKNKVETAVFDHGSTVSFEYTSPENRIVLPYQTDELRVLGARKLENGAYWGTQGLHALFGDYMTEDHTHMVDDPVEFINDIPNMKGIEGFVIGLKRGQGVSRVKVKTSEYLSLHRAKDSVNSNKRLFEVCLNDASDDLRSLFKDDPYTIAKITEMEQRVGHVYNSMVQSVEDFHRDNKHLDRKSYAIKGQEELDKIAFGLAMCLYSGRKPDYRGRIMSNYKLWVEDNDVETTET
jgi:T4 RnlA family RNA ligase